MLVLHAGLMDDGLLLWGEAASDDGPPVRRRGRPGRNGPAPALPFGAGEARLRAALDASGLAGVAAGVRAEGRVAWLPTVAGAPVASGPLIAEPPSADAPASLAPWAIAGLPLTVAAALDLLVACLDRAVLAPGVVIGGDLAAWAAALRLAGALVARQQVLPDVVARNGAAHAAWTPLVAGADAERLDRLAAALPPAARALGADAATPPAEPAVAALRRFLALAVDALVRATAAPAPAPPPRGRRPAFASLHDQWLHALRVPDGRLDGDPAALAAFAAQMREWQRPITLPAAAPFRLCLRLEEPAADDRDEAAAAGSPPDGAGDRDAWYVRYLLQAADDPSLLVPAAEVWQARGRTAALLRRGAVAGREVLLAALGQAAGLAPEVAASLRVAKPAGYALDTAGAHRFLTERAPLLEEAGVGVLLPAWWTRRGARRRLTARASVRSAPAVGGGRLTLDALVAVDWTVALGDAALSAAELEALAALKAPLVRVRGQWVELRPEELQAALDALRRGPAELTAGEAVRLALGAAGGPGDLPLDGVAAGGWFGELLARLEGDRAAAAELAPAAGFQGTLRPYQRRGLAWLAFLAEWGLGGCLADDMGLGKGVVTLALLQRRWAEAGRRPTLLVCPTSLVGNWQREAARFTPDLPVLAHHGGARPRGESFASLARRHALVITSYALLQRDLERFRAVAWAGVILDEAQNIKNSETKQARAALALPAGFRLALTGTPVENGVADLWSIMAFLNPGLLGGQAAFRRAFVLPIQAGRDPEAAARLKRLTGPFVLRRLKTDKAIIADLPAKQEMTVYCTLTPEQATLYRAVTRELETPLDEAAGMERRGLILATLSKLKQVCNHPAQFLGDGSALAGRSGKLARLTEMLAEVLAVGERALVFTQFAQMGALLQRHLQETFGREALFLHGGVPKAGRDRMVERFQAAGGPPVFLLSLKAGGTGLTLTAATHVFHYDRWWNPAVENQATDRAFRIGQTSDVQVHKFVCAGTLEERIAELIDQKRALAERVVGAGEAWLTELSTAELKELVALRAEAIGEEVSNGLAV